MSEPYGLLGMFSSGDEVVAAVEGARAAGFTRWETFTPYAVEKLVEMRREPESRSPVGWAMAIGGALSAAGAFFMEEFATHIYPQDVASRPLNSWPAFIPITFELGVLGASLTGLVALLIKTGLPRLHHPVFEAPNFRRASQDRFFLLLRSNDPKFERSAAEGLLRSLGAESVEEVPS